MLSITIQEHAKFTEALEEAKEQLEAAKSKATDAKGGEEEGEEEGGDVEMRANEGEDSPSLTDIPEYRIRSTAAIAALQGPLGMSSMYRSLESSGYTVQKDHQAMSDILLAKGVDEQRLLKTLRKFMVGDNCIFDGATEVNVAHTNGQRVSLTNDKLTSFCKLFEAAQERVAEEGAPSSSGRGKGAGRARGRGGGRGKGVKSSQRITSCTIIIEWMVGKKRRSKSIQMTMDDYKTVGFN